MSAHRTALSWQPRRLLFVGGSAALALLLSAGGAVAEGCDTASGKFTLAAVAGPDCESPVGLCATGELKGALKGDVEFTATSVVPSADTPATGVVFVTGDAVITTQRGQLFEKNAITLRTIGAGEFAETNVIVGGTGDYAGATGTLQSTGTFTAAAGGQGRYIATVCTP